MDADLWIQALLVTLWPFALAAWIGYTRRGVPIIGPSPAVRERIRRIVRSRR